MESFALLRTNVGLTTNVKLVVTSDYALYLDSIVSTPELSDTRFKRFRFNKEQYWDDLLPAFYQNIPPDLAFKVKFDNDDSNMSDDFANQYDDIYQYGARNIVDNKFYNEEFEYFAPLHISNKKFPTNFIIFRLDGPGLFKLDKNNFNSEILKKLKVVKNFDLSLKTNLGQWINNSFILNRYYPNQSLFIDFRQMEFSYWKGIDFDRGGYTEKSFMMDSVLEYEQPYSEMEKFILDGYKNNKVIYPNLVNFSFLFDDTPATKTSLRKWSLNRYLGFYFDDLTLVRKYSPNVLPKMRLDVIVDENNLLYSPSNDTPFLEEWRDNSFPYIEINGVYYKIEEFRQDTNLQLQKIKNTQSTYEDVVSITSKIKYKIISDISLEGIGFNDINKNLIKIDSNNRLTFQDDVPVTINDFDSADVWIIEIGDRFHSIIYEDGYYVINTDYGFRQSREKFEYFINDPDPNYLNTIDLITKNDYPPIEFNIYKCKFTNIKQFDTDIVDTEYSKFEYIKSNSLTNTDEPKMYVEDLESTSNPKDLVEFRLQNNIINLPTSSEYTANSETFRIISNSLSSLWRKNEVRLKWGFVGSLSSNDYPYLLNNSFLSEDYNRTCDTSGTELSRTKRNLDFFYTINSDSDDYSFHSLHIEDYKNGTLDPNFDFRLEHYLGLTYSLDYFNYLFSKKLFFEKGSVSKRGKKYSTFMSGDTSIPNITLFRGLRFRISEVDNINISDNKIQKINLRNSNKFEDWKFSILTSQNDYIILPSGPNTNDTTILKSENVLKWAIIDDWKHEKDYDIDTLALFNDILYQSKTASRIINPSDNPSNSNQWTPYTQSSIFYSPLYKGLTNSNNMTSFDAKYPPLVYNSGDYYYSDGRGLWDFWQNTATYSTNNVVSYKGKNWISLVNSNKTIPSETSGYYVDSEFVNTWQETNIPTRWTKVELWNSEKDYGEEVSWDNILFTFGNYALYDGVVYATTDFPTPGTPPNIDSKWIRIYSLVPDTTYLYSTTINANNIISLNGKYYQCLSNTYPFGYQPDLFYNFTLDNGIYVIINEKFKNILINIYINDNTYNESTLVGNYYQITNSFLKNTNRDDIYQSIYRKLSVNNIMNCLNDLSNNFGFSDKVKYVIVGEDGKVKIYDFNDLNNVGQLPYLLTCSPADQFFVRKRSNILQSSTLKSSEIKPKRILNDSNIENLGQINWYNEMHLASIITKNIQKTVSIPNYSGLTNDNFNKIYRHTGFYEPITRDVELFDSPSFSNGQTNYKFDTELTNFGLMRQRIVSKVNRKGNLLKLRNNSKLQSIYPMVDEYGYHIVDFFIFKSTWDYEYHYETQEYEVDESTSVSQSKVIDVGDPTFRNNNNRLL